MPGPTRETSTPRPSRHEGGPRPGPLWARSATRRAARSEAGVMPPVKRMALIGGLRATAACAAALPVPSRRDCSRPGRNSTVRRPLGHGRMVGLRTGRLQNDSSGSRTAAAESAPGAGARTPATERGAGEGPPAGSAPYLRRYPRNERLPFGGCAPRRHAATLREPVRADGSIGVGSLGLLPGSQPQPRCRRRDGRWSPRHRAPARPRAPGRIPPRASSLAPCRP